jgi:hypothetical protein
LVSIPVGFSASLRYRCSDGHSAALEQFQSLSGFQPRCDGILRRALLGYNPF